jgi:short subunit fatty acids transporter
VKVVGPAAGEQACGEVGEGRMLEPLEIMLFLAQLKFAEQPEAIAVYREYGIPDQGGIFIQFAAGGGLGKMMGFAADKKHELAGRLGSHVMVIAAVNSIGR